MPVPGLALRAMYGEMSQVITTGVRALPAKALVLGFDFRHPRPADRGAVLAAAAACEAPRAQRR
jgi:NAD dependent epimerase/dehydratase family enzyme